MRNENAAIVGIRVIQKLHGNRLGVVIAQGNSGIHEFLHKRCNPDDLLENRLWASDQIKGKTRSGKRSRPEERKVGISP